MTNAIAISRDLAAAGVEKKAADAIAEAVVRSEENFATKADLEHFAAKTDFAHLEGSVATKADLARLESKFESKMAQLETRLTDKLTWRMIVCAGLIIAVLGFIIKA